MALGLTRFLRLLVVAFTIAGGTAGAALADRGGREPTLQFLGQQIVPTGTQFEGTEFGGLSGFAFDERPQRLLRPLGRPEPVRPGTLLHAPRSASRAGRPPSRSSA